MKRSLALVLTLCLWAAGADAWSQTTTYYLTDSNSISGSATIWNMSTVAPSSGADDSTSINLLVGALSNYQFIPGTSSNNILSILSTFTGGGWETPALTGTLPSGPCTLNVKLANSSLVSLAGYVEARLLVGTATDGSNAVTLTSWITSGTLLSLAANQVGTDNFPVNLSAPVSLNNSHLFLQVALGLTVAADVGVTFVSNESAESLIIPSIQPFTATPTVTSTATITFTPTMTATNTVTSTVTNTPTGTLTPAPTSTPTLTPTPGGNGNPSSLTPDGIFGSNHNAFDPTSGSVIFYYNVTQTGPVQLVLYNVMGLAVKTLFNGTQPPGVWSVSWDGHNDNGGIVAPDVYFVKLRMGNNTYLRKIAVIRRSK